MSKEAMKLALEALKQIDEAMPFPVAKLAQAALREALAEKPERPYRLLQDNGSKYFGASWDKAEQPAQQALDKMAENARELGIQMQPAQQEPVAWMYPDDYERMTTSETFCTVYSVEVGSATRGETTVALYTSPPAQRKPLTDDPLQGAVDWLLEADGEYFCTATVQRTLRIGYNRAKRLCDTAKERAAHGIKGDA